MFSKLSYSICHIYIYITVLVQIKKKNIPPKETISFTWYPKIIRENVFKPLSQDCTMNSVISDESSKY